MGIGSAYTRSGVKNPSRAHRRSMSAMRVCGILAICGLTAGAVADDGSRAVPKDWLAGDTLIVGELNFTVTAPTGWGWRTREIPTGQGIRTTAFMAVAPDESATRVLMVWHEPTKSLPQAEAEEFVDGMLKSLPAGWRSLGVRLAPSEIPTSGSTRLQSRLVGPENAELYQWGYFVPGRLTYTLLTFTEESEEPADFLAFAKSFRVLDPQKNSYQRPLRTVLVPIYLALLLVTILIDIIRLVRGRRSAPGTAVSVDAGQVEGQAPTVSTESSRLTVWSYVLLLMGLSFNVMIGFTSPATADDPPRALGRAVGTALWPAVIAYLFGGRRNPATGTGLHASFFGCRSSTLPRS